MAKVSSSLKLNGLVQNCRKVIGAGWNYKSLIEQKGFDTPTKPVLFMKPSTSLITEGMSIKLPKGFDVNQEVELGVVVGKNCRNVKESKVMDYVGGYCVALDLTAMNLLFAARKAGEPWLLGKGFDTACPIGNFVPKEKVPNPQNLTLWCKINGVMKQEASTSEMIFSVAHLVSYAAQFLTLEAGDILLTGSPCGVCSIHPGDVIEAGVGELSKVKVPVAEG